MYQPEHGGKSRTCSHCRVNASVHDDDRGRAYGGGHGRGHDYHVNENVHGSALHSSASAHENGRGHVHDDDGRMRTCRPS